VARLIWLVARFTLYACQRQHKSMATIYTCLQRAATPLATALSAELQLTFAVCQAIFMAHCGYL